MALRQTIGSLLHGDQLRDLREQADTLFGKAKAEVQPAVEHAQNAGQSVQQTVLGYLPQIIEYAGLFAELFRSKAEPAPAPERHRQQPRPSMIATVRPYVLGAVIVGALGYAAYVMARNRR